MPEGPSEWYFSIPPFTRYWLTVAFLTTFGITYDFIQPKLIRYSFESIWDGFEIWRFFTTFMLFGRFSMNFFIQLMMTYQFSAQLEQNPYPSKNGSHQGNIADFSWMFICIGIFLCIIDSLVLHSGYLASAMLSAIIYAWSKREPTRQASFMYIGKVPAHYLPWVMVGFKLVTGQDFMTDIVGILAGHIYYFVKTELPEIPGIFMNQHLLTTPQWFCNLLKVPRTDLPEGLRIMRGNAGGNQLGNGGGATNRYFGGAGRVLGRD